MGMVGEGRREEAMWRLGWAIGCCIEPRASRRDLENEEWAKGLERAIY